MVLTTKNISENSLKQKIEDLLKKKAEVKNKHSWNKFFGKVKSIKDPIAYQRKLRDE